MQRGVRVRHCPQSRDHDRSRLLLLGNNETNGLASPWKSEPQQSVRATHPGFVISSPHIHRSMSYTGLETLPPGIFDAIPELNSL